MDLVGTKSLDRGQENYTALHEACFFNQAGKLKFSNERLLWHLGILCAFCFFVHLRILSSGLNTQFFIAGV